MKNRVQIFEKAAEECFSGSAPGGAVLVGSGENVWAEGFGLADVEAGVPITADTRFLIGSVSKQFTAMAVLVLAEQGKLGLDDPVTRYFPSFPAYGQAITVRHLLTHTSGIPEYLVDEFWNDPQHQQRDVTLEEVIQMIHSYDTADFSAGSVFSYCNSGYVLLGDIIQQCSGKSFKDFVTETLLQPAGMIHTQVGEDPLQTVEQLARGYREKADGIMEPAPYTMATIGWADGNLISTVGDLYSWHKMLQRQAPVSEKWLKEAFTPYHLQDGSPTGYGLGWFIHDRRGIWETWHSGGTQGFTCRFSRFPEQDAAIVILTNYETSPRDYLTGVLARNLLGDVLTPLTGTVPAEEVKQVLAGTYQSAKGDMEITLLRNLDALTGKSPLWADHDEIPLLSVSPDCYRLDSPHEYWLQVKFDDHQNPCLVLNLNGRRIHMNKV